MTTTASPTSNQDLPDLSTPRRVHLIGIGGAGMSAIAEVLVAHGHEVSGSDLSLSPPAERLMAAGATVHAGHDATHVGDVDFVAHSTAIPATNPELVAATARGLPVLRRAELLAAITQAQRTISVAGTHGKTTTTAMLTIALQAAGLDPAYIVGGDMVNLGRGAGVGRGEMLVVEADESDGTFVELDSHGIIVTNVEPDHLEFYGSFDRLQQCFVRFVANAPGPGVICIDDAGARELAQRSAGVITYGTAPEADWRIVRAEVDEQKRYAVTVSHADDRWAFSLAQPGLHNARNATAAFAMAVALGADPSVVADGLTQFRGVARRFERRGSVAGVDFVDEYSHLPTEVAAAIATARELKPTRVVGVFQPHRFSRTAQLWSTFADSFVGLDVFFVTGIYASGEQPRPGISGELIANCVRQAHPEADVRYIEHLADVPKAVAAELRSGDLCLTMGAGDLTTIPDAIVEILAGAEDER